MLQINLLKDPKLKAHQKKGISLKIVATIAISGVLGFVLVIGGIYLISSGNKELDPEKSITVSDIQKKAPKSPNVVEDVVDKVSDPGGVEQPDPDVLGVRYSDMSLTEKINYEAIFTKNVIEMFDNIVPVTVGFKSIEITDFESVHAVGLGPTQEAVTSLFVSLKNANGEFLKPPYSYIKPNGNQGYRFVFTFNPVYGLDLADPFQAVEHLGSRDNLPFLLKTFTDLAIKNGVSFTTEPKRIDSEKVDSYRRFTYRFSGLSSYRQFVSFILSLHEENVPCAFSKVALQARNRSSIQIDADIIFTTR